MLELSQQVINGYTKCLTHTHTHTPECVWAHPSGNQISLIRHMNYSKSEETKAKSVEMQMPIKLYNYKIFKLNYG